MSSVTISIGGLVAKKLPTFLKKHLLRNENIESRIFKTTNFEFIIERDVEQISDILLNNAIEGVN